MIIAETLCYQSSCGKCLPDYVIGAAYNVLKAREGGKTEDWRLSDGAEVLRESTRYTTRVNAGHYSIKI